ncbi:uncharacterized protein OCT59_009104 [Rhizophagus irregularis]|uniref:uncharacterized protein n=1 Tax=Rhizophagus irregularis TaxID=588596 RepID=UPI00333072BC|nr:hypothetical protein OCT59_009104 [Rhizophagus irregularis]
MNKNTSSLRLVSGVSDSHLEELQRSRMLNWTYFKKSETEFWTLISKIKKAETKFWAPISKLKEAKRQLKKAKRQVQISISKEAERTSQTFKSKVKEAENKFQTSISKVLILQSFQNEKIVKKAERQVPNSHIEKYRLSWMGISKLFGWHFEGLHYSGYLLKRILKSFCFLAPRRKNFEGPRR